MDAARKDRRHRPGHRQEARAKRERDRVRAVPCAELRDHPLAIALHRLGGEEQPRARLRRRLAVRRAGQDLTLARSQRLTLQDLPQKRRHAARLRKRVEPVCTSVCTRPVLTPRSLATSAALSPSTVVRTSATRSLAGRVASTRRRSRLSSVASGVGRGSGGSYVIRSSPSPFGPRSLKLTTSAYVPSPSELRRARDRIASMIAPRT